MHIWGSYNKSIMYRDIHWKYIYIHKTIMLLWSWMLSNHIYLVISLYESDSYVDPRQNQNIIWMTLSLSPLCTLFSIILLIKLIIFRVWTQVFVKWHIVIRWRLKILNLLMETFITLILMDINTFWEIILLK